MGNGPSRQRREDTPVYQRPRYIVPPSQLPCPPPRYPQYSPDPTASAYPSGFYHQQYHVPNPHMQYWPVMPPAVHSIPGERASITSPDSSQQTVTVRNAVNIKKGTIQLIKDIEHPGFYLLTFSYDAEASGSFNIFLFAKEDEKNCSIKPLYPDLFVPLRIPFESGVAKTFKQAPGSGIYLDGIDSTDLEKEGEDQICPLVIRAQTNAPESEATVDATVENIGAALPKSVNSQITEAVIERNENRDCKVRVLRQIIWVDGVRYELKELYGIESAMDKNEYDEDDFGKECVICMSETRDMAVMPCRHMCMCSGCAADFKNQMNKCPICRQQVESLLKINVKRN